MSLTSLCLAALVSSARATPLTPGATFKDTVTGYWEGNPGQTTLGDSSFYPSSFNTDGTLSPDIVFLQPGTTPGAAIFTSSLTGTADGIESDGGPAAFFNNALQTFSDSNGTFDIPLASPIAINSNSSGLAGINAIMNASPAPEPSSLFLLGTGLIGVAGFARHKLRKS